MIDNQFTKLLRKKKVIIGAIHFSPSPGFFGFDGLAKAVKRAQFDLDTLINGGVDAVIFENNYDLPHHIKVGHNTTAFMTSLISNLKFRKEIPFGISVLWNDYEAALSIAKVTGASFIRIPAFVDSVKTDYGIARSVSKKAIKYRTMIGANNIAILADVHVKHATLINPKKTLTTSIMQAENNDCDGVIITGKWTGDAPIINDLQLAKSKTNLPIFVGSGADASNIINLFSYADGVIVSTSIKTGIKQQGKKNPNLKTFEQRFDIGKVKALVKHAETCKYQSPIAIFSSFSEDQLIKGSKKILTQNGGPMLFIESAMSNTGASYYPVFGSKAKIKIYLRHNTETGKFVTKPKMNKLQNFPIAEVAAVSTILTEWDLIQIVSYYQKVFVDIQGYARSSATQLEKLANQLKKQNKKIYCIKGTEQEIARLPNSLIEDQKNRLLICTRGQDNIVVYIAGKKHIFNVEPVSNLTDTIGAGDYFFGYMLGQMQHGKTTIMAIDNAISATHSFLKSKAKEGNWV